MGYVDEALNAAAFTEDGWFRTGDLAEIGADARIRIVGRLKDVVIRNAENISATEVEEADYDYVTDTNCKGAFFVAQAVGRSMIAQFALVW